ncbi:BZ3500_MvSof-1268-A1-R1_Chr1-3g02336 [Microbotryum saponariae]|uniref:Eukaryotic translation initiation factor 2A n=1 Tax=Microbotryum saponariae TaxID=289078 RepID=A0A2X0KSV9_9BASI|nr:BZ3500_MvSof-1268-A1-R1_Chr1-3g02336 [Microbotryum saponariae]SCZ96027.1 BZ3501_MvSof-1269-A2-R1_Chr1-3g01939 [Microbotryum saponariae]
MATAQYSFRALKSTGLVTGPPDYSALSSYQRPEETVKAQRYSSDGRLFAYCTATGVQVLDAETAANVASIPVRGAIDIAFSPKGTQISTWERHVKPADGEPPHHNLRVWDVATATEVASFSQKAMDRWQLQYTEDEAKAVRIVTNEVHVFNAADFASGIAEKLRAEGVTSCTLSTGANPAVALFFAEKKGAPASVKIHSLEALQTQTCIKTFYKADKITMKWNRSGSNLLFLTQTDVDKTGKSYYGETNLYMMSSAGNFDCRVTLDKEGGIHDFTWSPNDREFAVTYGSDIGSSEPRTDMPAKTVIFDQRVNVINDFGLNPRNFLAYNPQGRLLCIAGFGNLAGQVDVWDRKTLKKVCTFEAPNSVHCEWSPDGRYLMCATLSPRLRVDNGVRFYHCTGGLMHIEAIEELYSVSWRPAPVNLFPFGGPIDAAPSASISVANATPNKPAAATGGAYRPPHARGTLTPTVYKREDEGGAAYDGTTAFPSSANGRTSPTFGARRRAIPGAAAPSGESGTTEDPSRRKKKGNNNNGKNSANGSGAATPSTGAAATPAVPVPQAAAEVLAGELSPIDKKRRALQKKLTAIEGLKEKKAAGEKLELTQYKKLDSEADIRKELAALELEK